MGWRAWTTSCLVAALAGVLAGAVYVAATGTFDPRPATAASLPGPNEQTASGRPAPTAAPPATAAPQDTSTASKAHEGKAKKPGAKEGTAKAPKAKSKAAKASPKGEVKSGGKKASGKRQK